MSYSLPRPAAIALALAAGLGVVSVIGLVQQSMADNPDTRSFSAPANSAPANSRPTAVAPSRSPEEGGNRRLPDPPTQLPLRVTVPRLGVDARVLPTGVEPSGQAEIPTDGDDIGWYEYGSAPGDSRGSAVLIGHRDTVAEGAGALFNLDELRPDDRIVVTNRLGTVTYGVTGKVTYDKAALPASLFNRTGLHVLHLITCGGDFLPEFGGYQENLVVTAEVLRSTPKSG